MSQLCYYEREMLEKALKDGNEYIDEDCREDLEDRFSRLDYERQLEVCILVANDGYSLDDALNYEYEYEHRYNLNWYVEDEAEFAYNMVDTFMPQIKRIQSKGGEVYLDDVIDYYELLRLFESRGYIKRWEYFDDKVVFYW